MADHATDRLPDIAKAALGPLPIVVVCDENTWLAAGRDVVAKLRRSCPTVSALVMPGKPQLKPLVEHGRRIAAELRSSGSCAIAVGSGVINDLTKYASALVGQPYICVPTAASMDGYTASGAPLLENEFKRTAPCAPPIAVIADPQIAVAAPAPMASWGYGDLAGKFAAGGDWMLADALGEEAIGRVEWDLVQGNLRSWLSNPVGVRDCDPVAVRGLLEGLLISRLAVQSYGNSRPASGSDHQFSHLWEMEGLMVDGVPVAHGVCVGIGCLASLALYDWLIAQDLTRITPDALVRRRCSIANVEAGARACFMDTRLGDAAVAEVRAKHPDGVHLRKRLDRLRAAWSALRDRLSLQLPRAASVRERLAVQGLPVHPHALGIDLAAFAKDHKRAAMIRRRFTIFDLLQDVDLFDDAITATTGPGGFWR